MITPVPALKPSRLIKPTLDTPYHIDFDWWNRADRNLRVYLKSHLCDVHREMYANSTDADQVDWVDVHSAEVRPMDGILYLLRTHCSLQPDYIHDMTSIVDAVFRVFLANGNQPMNPRELGERVGKDPELILRTISGKSVYQGLRPVMEQAA